MRDLLFLSHAYPEDNEFARWAALRLMSHGYPVWCDLVSLKGGEDFWREAEQAIRNRAVRFLFTLSRTSNVKDGTLQEIAVAKEVARSEKIKNFIIPLLIDDLPRGEINIEIKRLGVIPFNEGWAKGLAQLLEKLEQDQVPKDDLLTPASAASWWREQYSASKGVIEEAEDYLSNWFPTKALPQTIYFHILHKPQKKASTGQNPAIPYPVYKFGNGVLSFATQQDLSALTIDGMVIGDTHPFITENLLKGWHAKTFMTSKQARDAVTHLFGQAWRIMIEGRRLSIHGMANDRWCFHFNKDQVEKDRLNFAGIDGKPAYRYVMGYRSTKTRSGEPGKRHWHFGISATPLLYPVNVLAVKPHVLFSDDGCTIWTSHERLHRARMSQCRNWWNDDWRDRMLATMQWLAGNTEWITVPVSGEGSIEVGTSPILFVSPVSYLEPGSEIEGRDDREGSPEKPEPEEIEDDFDEDDEEDE